jgi:ADP-heptose:LPS heptosyltransferase
VTAAVGQVTSARSGGLRVGPIGQRLDGVRRIAVLRGGGLGDVLFACPAVQSLADAYPQARVTLLTSPARAELFTGRPGPIHEVRVLPVAHGIHEPPGAQPDPVALERFFAQLSGLDVDLAVQLHGGGRWSNPFVRRLAARYTVGARSEDADPLDRWIPYRYYQNEVMRALEVVGLAGAVPTCLQPMVTVADADRDAADEPLAGLPRPLLTLHPGATDPRRRWPAERFAAVAADAAGRGAGVAVIGSLPERELVHRVVAQARDRLSPARQDAVRPLAGVLSSSALVGTLAASDAVLANDSGPAHLAQAVGVATVRLYWVGNVITAGPPGRHDQRVLISWQTACPVCGVSYTDPAVPRCPHSVSALTEIPVRDALTEVHGLLAAG